MGIKEDRQKDAAVNLTAHPETGSAVSGIKKQWPLGQLQACARGFTLLELLVVIAIIGLLAGLVAPRYFDQVSKSNTKVARAQIDSLEKALDQYRLDMGSYPSTELGLMALNTRPQNMDKWAGPYLKKAVPLDPWGGTYVYKSPGDHSDYDLLSQGSDGQVGGAGEAADITSWAP